MTETRKPRIKIGSQRETEIIKTGSSRQSAAAAPPAEPASPAAEDASAAATASEEAAPGASETAAAPTPTAETHLAESPSASLAPLEAPVEDELFPTPVWKQPSAELEDELEAAFANVDFDSLMQAATAPAPAPPELEADARVKGRVLKVHQDNVFFTLGEQAEGVTPLKHFKEAPEPGTEFDLVVNRFAADEGLYELTPAGQAMDIGDWSEVSEGLVVEARVTGVNQGGLECVINNALRGFIPASQIAIHRVDDFSEYLNTKFDCVITEANPARRNLVLSRRAMLEREREANRQQLLESLQPGTTVEGVVRSVRDFGAFVDLGGIDGLVHVSRLSWERVNHPSDVVKEGERIKVKIEKVDPTTGKIALSHRDVFEHPWAKVPQKYPAGSVVSGVVSKVADFGAFVRIEAGIEGLIHISELAHYRVSRVGSIVNEGDAVQAKILSVDPDKQRIALSMKALIAQPEPEPAAAEAPAEEEPAPRKPPRNERNLKGGTNKPSGGESFGLKW